MKKFKSISVLLCTAMLATSILTACGSSTKTKTSDDSAAATSTETSATETSTGNQLAVVLGSEPDTMDPTLNSANDAGTTLEHLFEGLMRQSEDGTMKPAQAESCKVSDDGLTYTFTLRDGLKWSDGTPLTAKDYVYSWNRAVDPATAADYEYLFSCVKGYEDKKLAVTAPDDKTLVVELNAITPYFLEIVGFPVYMPVQQAAVEKGGEAWATDASTYVSNGPYIMKEWVHDSYILAEKNPNYWNVDALGPDSIKFVLMADDSAMLAAYQTNEVQMIDSVPNDEIQALSAQSDFHKEGQIGTYYVSYNTTNEYLKNPKVREALTLAIDRKYICEQIGQAGQVPAGAFVATGLTDATTDKQFRDVGGDYYNPTDYEGNLVKAKAALAEAGYPDGKGLPVFEYIYNEGTGHQQIGEALQNMWSKIGVQIELQSQEWNTFLQTRKSGDYDIARNGWLGDYNDPISFLDMWVTGGGNNDAQWSNPEYDALIKQVQATGDQTQRYALMHKAEDLMFQEWMLCPIYYYVDIYMIKDNVKGVYTSPLGHKFFMYATMD